jgi:microcompartment protein CcmK/EutM
VASVSELSDPYANFMFGPRHGTGVCSFCFNLTRGFERCYSCARGELALAAVVPISYSVGGEQLHHALMGYKRLNGEIARRLTVELAAILWRFLALHEQCVAAAAGVPAFELVTTVPSGAREHDDRHPLRHIVGDLVGPTRWRYRRLLRRSPLPVGRREVSAHQFEPLRRLRGERVLLIDDTWTTGASARSAAVALDGAGAGLVAAVVIGRYLNRHWGENDRRLGALVPAFDWGRCGVCGRTADSPGN